MKEAYWGYWLVILGVFVVVVMLLIQNVTSNNTESTYSIKQISEAAMVDAIDYAYYREYGELRITKEKFIESFLRRFAESASLTTEYKITFAGIYEAPPKVSVEVTSKTQTYSIGTSSETFDMTSRVNAILEQNDKKEESTPTDTACTAGVNTSTDFAGVVGVAMDATHLNKTASLNESIKSIPVNGTKFTINGIYNNDDSIWNINYNGECGWVDATKMAVNLEDYIPEMKHDIVNKRNRKDGGAIYMSAGHEIPNITGEQLYTNDYVPLARYSFAKSLKTAAAAANANGDKLVVYDAYRPQPVTQETYKQFEYLFDGKTGVTYDQKNITSGGWKLNNFFAKTTSTHNRACAVDITIEGATMPTAMHELSIAAIKYKSPSSTEFSESFKKSSDAVKLKDYMESAGLKGIASEWWHYQAKDCTSYNPASFWSNM